MGGIWKAVWQGMKEGARAAPRDFFFPVTAFAHWVDRVQTDERRRQGPWSPSRMVLVLRDSHRDLKHARRLVFERFARFDHDLHRQVLEVMGDPDTAAIWMDEPLGPGRGTPYHYLAAHNRNVVCSGLEAWRQTHMAGAVIGHDHSN
ncbi:MAG: hypothetical protein EPN56_00880 [Rhodanobacter sp.]|nr:MAG: hypothetical protein EPN56_00880 [Rhodanobacter sp.]